MDFAAGVYLSEAQDPIPPAYTLHMCKQYTYSIGKGGTGGGGLNQRESEWGKK
jgi:hypothetical protein